MEKLKMNNFANGLYPIIMRYVKTKYALKHAASKKADVAVVYDKHQVYHRLDVENGIKQFEQYSKYRFKRIIVVSKSGNVYEHSHN